MSFPVLFVHGMWSSGAVWEGFAARYAARGHTVRAPTLPHHAVGEAPAEGLASLGLADYLAFLRQQADAFDTPPLLVGHGLGALLAMRLAAERVGFASVHLGTIPTGASLRPLRVTRTVMTRPGWWRRPVHLARTTAAWAWGHALDPRARDRMLSGLTYESGRALRELALGTFSHAWVGRHGLPHPSLVVHGTEDRFAPIGAAKAATRRAGPKATFTQLAGRAHWLPAEPGWERLADDVAHWARSFAP